MISSIIISLAGILLLFGSAYLSYKYSWKSIPALIAVVSLIVFFYRDLQGINSIVTPAIIGSAGGITFRSGSSIQSFLLISSILLTVSFTGNYYYQLRVHDFDMVKESRAEMEKMLIQNKAPDDIRDQFLGDFDAYENIIRDIVPFSSFIYALILSALAFMGMSFIFPRFKFTRPVKGLEYFRLHDYSILALLGGWGVFLLTNRNDYHAINTIALNIALMSTVLYIIQAMGVIKFYIKKKGLPIYLFPLLFFIVIFLGIETVVFFSVLLAGLGTLDFWADFRKIEINKDSRSEQ